MPTTDILDDLDSVRARSAIDALARGEPPPLEIVDALSIGIERDLDVFAEEYFAADSPIVDTRTKSSTFKIVEAYYGGGKTHYLRAVQRVAMRHNFATAFVNLTKEECPLTRFDQVYASVCQTLRVPEDGQVGQDGGFARLIRHWVERRKRPSEDLAESVNRALATLPDLPLVGMKIAVKRAALSCAVEDEAAFDEAMQYLTTGRVSPTLRKAGISQAIDRSNGSLGLRSIAGLTRALDYAGLVLVLDEGDRSLSLGSTKDRQAASNNLVQLFNETARSDWPSSVLLYSIPSWQSFEGAFQGNNALIQRARSTGFPDFPPATRIVLDNREEGEKARVAFCTALAARLDKLVVRAYPGRQCQGDPDRAAADAAQYVCEKELDAGYKRLFVESYLQVRTALLRSKLSPAAIHTVVDRAAGQISQSG